MRRAFDAVAMVFFGSVLLLPLLYFFASSIFAFDVSSLTGTFFWIVLRAWFAGFVQAAISAAFVCVLASFFALSLLRLSSRHQWILSHLNSWVGRFYFVLPGTVVSLMLLSLPFSISENLAGWPLIILAHTLWSLLLMTDILHRKLAAWLNNDGRDLLSVAQTLGASPGQGTRYVLWPYLRTELREVFVLVFVWSFGAFSTVFLLGRGPQHSTLEVLTFYTLMNDLDATRLMILVGLNLITQYWVLKKFYFRSIPQGMAAQEIPLYQSRSIELGLPKGSHGFLLLSLAALVFLIAKHVWGLGTGSRSLEELPLQSALGNTVVYALCCSVLGLILSALISGLSSWLRRALLFLFALSPMVLAASWSYWRMEYAPELESNLPLSALALCLTQVPLLALWMDSALSNLDRTHEVYLNTLGLNSFQKLFYFRWPYLKDVFLKIQVLLFSMALGDLVMASTFAPREALLSQLSRKLSQSYDFEAASWVFVLSLLLIGLWMGVLELAKRLWTRRV